MMIEHAETDEQIAATFDVMAQLRPHLVRTDYVRLIRGLMETERFRLVTLLDGGEVRAVAGYRFMDMLYCGRLLYLEDSLRTRAFVLAGTARACLPG